MAPSTDIKEIIALRHKVYTELLEKLTLHDVHYEHLLKKRCLRHEEIVRNGYRTLPAYNQQIEMGEIAEELATRYELCNVPGFYQRGDDNKWTMKLNSDPLLMIPIRNYEGMITGIRLRTNWSNAKYIVFSSKDEKNGSSLSTQHMLYWPLNKKGRIEETSVLRITEGEFKAETATSMTNVYTVGLLGVNSVMNIIKDNKDDWIKKGIREIYLCFDSDREYKAYSESINKTVGQYLAEAYIFLTEQTNIITHIEYWDEKAHKGIDDLLLDEVDGLGKIKKMLPEEAQAWAAKMADDISVYSWALMTNQNSDFLDLIEARGIYESTQERTLMRDPTAVSINPTRNVFKKRQDFNHLMRRYGIKDPHDYLCAKKDLLVIEGNDYVPNQPMLIKRGSSTFYNRWRKFAVDPKEGDVEWFFQHMARILPNNPTAAVPDHERQLTIGYLMHYLARSHIMLPSMLILFSEEEGTGKTFLFSKIIGPILHSNMKIASTKDTQELTKFNSFLLNKSLVVLDEINSGEKDEITDFLKNLLTDNFLTTEEKYHEKQSVSRRVNLAATTNKPNALRISEYQRRFRFVKVCSPFPFDAYAHDDYYTTLVHSITPDKLSALLFYAMHNFDFTWFDRESKGKHDTETNKAIFEECKSYALTELEEHIKAAFFPFGMDVLTYAETEAYYKEKYRSSKTVISKIKFSKTIERMGWIRCDWTMRNDKVGERTFYMKQTSEMKIDGIPWKQISKKLDNKELSQGDVIKMYIKDFNTQRMKQNDIFETRDPYDNAMKRVE